MLESCLDEQDWSLACLVCQALWNYCIDSNNITESIVDEDCLCNLEGKCLSLCNPEYKITINLVQFFLNNDYFSLFRHFGVPS